VKLALPSPGIDGIEVVTAAELVVTPDDVDAWTQASLQAGVPAAARVHVLRTSEHRTETGWPLRVVESEVRAAGDRVVEVRAHAFYAFLDHGAVAVARAASAAAYERGREALLAALRRGAPDFAGPIAALAQLHDLPETAAELAPLEDPPPPPQPPAPPPSLEQIFAAANAARGDFAKLAAALAHVDERLQTSAGPLEHFVRGGILEKLGQRLEAADAYREAIRLDPGFAEAHFALGLACADLGRVDDALAAWEEAARARPGYVDAHYNIGQALYTRGEHERALARFRQALEHAPDDFFLLKKVAQAQHALGRHDDAERTRDELAGVWNRSQDPRVRQTSEYVFDQFQVAGKTVHAFETLRPPRPDFFSVLAFRVVDEHGHPTGLSAQLETSSVGREKGVPFVMTVIDGAKYRVAGTFSGRPGYAELKKIAEGLLAEAIQPRSSSGS
jgi:tetratricopeptide (TPR) repeat protein